MKLNPYCPAHPEQGHVFAEWAKLPAEVAGSRVEIRRCACGNWRVHTEIEYPPEWTPYGPFPLEPLQAASEEAQRAFDPEKDPDHPQNPNRPSGL